MFIQLDKSDCSYLLELIEDIDSSTLFTARQRGYTVPKLERIAQDPRSARLAAQDVDYLLELLEDDVDSPEEQQKLMTEQKLVEIRQLQNQKVLEQENIEAQRESRRARRCGRSTSEVAEVLLSEKFSHTK